MGEIFGDNVSIKKRVKYHIKQELLDDIHLAAKHLQMYDEICGEDDQCGGYEAFKELCLQVDDLPDVSLIEREDFISMQGLMTGAYQFKRIHPLARKPALELLNRIRKKHKIGQSWRNIKKESM